MKIPFRFVVLFFFTVLAVSVSVGAEEKITVNQRTIQLTDRNITAQLTLDLELERPESFDVTVFADSHGQRDNRFFGLAPLSRTGSAGNGQVKISLDFPYDARTAGGPYQIGKENTVERNRPRAASNHYSQCPVSPGEGNTTRVCKPLSFLVVDEASVPGVIYQTNLRIQITTQSGQVLQETVSVKYENTGSTIGIYSPNDRLELTTANRFRAENQFCVFSPGEQKAFDVKLEGDGPAMAHQLRGRSNRTVNYDASFSTTGRGFQRIAPNVWREAGNTIKVRKNFRDCRGDRNLTVRVEIPESEIFQSHPGQYHGTLTVRVRAK